MLFCHENRTLLLHQQGASITGWLGIITLAIIIAQLALKITPVYMESYTIKESLKSLSLQDDIKELPPGDILSQVRKKFAVNNIGKEASSALQVKRSDRYVHVMVDYEKRIPIVANIDVIISFEHFFNTALPDQCCVRQ